jgi:glutathione peroxidase-family protein
MSTFFDFQVEAITGETVDLADFRGRVCLVVNVASF